MLPEGELILKERLKLTVEGRKTDSATSGRRVSPLIKSDFEDVEKGFFPVTSVNQLVKKDYHRRGDILNELNVSLDEYNNLSQSSKLKVSFNILENLLKHPDTEIYNNSMAQYREPVFVILNRGLGDYPIPNHAAIYERKPEIYNYNSYITDYQLKVPQVDKFDNSVNTTIEYKDSFGNQITNIGPVIGSMIEGVVTDLPTSEGNPEL